MNQKVVPPPPIKAPPPRQATLPVANGTATAEKKDFAVSRGVTVDAQKIVIFGSGGTGKTSLCANMEQLGIKPLFLDLDGETSYLDVARVNIESWDELLAALGNEELCKPFDAIVIDSLTKAEEYAAKWTVAHVPHSKTKKLLEEGSSIEAYGYGEGPSYLYDTFLKLLAALDKHVRHGRHVVATAHDCTNSVPNPRGEDWIRYEPRLQSPKSGKGSIRLRVKEWTHHLLFIGYDVNVGEDGKGKGGDKRAIYPSEHATILAKSRKSLEMPVNIPYTAPDDATLWQYLFSKKEN